MPQIAYQVNALTRVSHNPGKAHWDATTKLIRYVSHHRNLGLVYTRPHRGDASASLCLWSDATWAPDYGTVYDNYRSTTGWCATAHDNLLSWTSHRQSTVAQSTSESEWHAAADAAKEAAHALYVLAAQRALIRAQLPNSGSLATASAKGVPYRVSLRVFLPPNVLKPHRLCGKY